MKGCRLGPGSAFFFFFVKRLCCRREGLTKVGNVFGVLLVLLPWWVGPSAFVSSLDVLFGNPGQPSNFGKGFPKSTRLVDVNPTELLGVRLSKLFTVRSCQVLARGHDQSSLTGQVLSWRKSKRRCNVYFVRVKLVVSGLSHNRQGCA